MSGGHWDYQSYKLKEQGDYLRGLFNLLGTIEHELDWGICGDTCLDCAKIRVVESLIKFFDGEAEDAQAVAKSTHQQYLCPRHAKEEPS